jgi:hypothetical protein
MTIKSYLASVEQLEAFLAEAGMTTDVTALHREHIETFIVHLVAGCPLARFSRPKTSWELLGPD